MRESRTEFDAMVQISSTNATRYLFEIVKIYTDRNRSGFTLCYHLLTRSFLDIAFDRLLVDQCGNPRDIAIFQRITLYDWLKTHRPADSSSDFDSYIYLKLQTIHRNVRAVMAIQNFVTPTNLFTWWKHLLGKVSIDTILIQNDLIPETDTFEHVSTTVLGLEARKTLCTQAVLLYWRTKNINEILLEAMQITVGERPESNVVDTVLKLTRLRSDDSDAWDINRILSDSLIHDDWTHTSVPVRTLLDTLRSFFTSIFVITAVGNETDEQCEARQNVIDDAIVERLRTMPRILINRIKTNGSDITCDDIAGDILPDFKNMCKHILKIVYKNPPQHVNQQPKSVVHHMGNAIYTFAGYFKINATSRADYGLNMDLVAVIDMM